MIARFVATVLLAGLVACAPGPTPPGPAAASAPVAVPAGAIGKPTAPVEVEAALQPGAARLAFTFGADAADVTVRVSGLDGLRVTSAPVPVERRSYRRGERAAVDATFVPGEGQSHLVVSVEGTFGGRHMTAVRSFAVGTRSPAQEEKARAGVVTDEKGERLHLLPAERR
ncbi:MAG TPA: hypothetical protein VFR85_08005 [Anaeromyxobacteraceae bacterium]|nr:hypothetical protein [Anaeromyxobacteraceae bacterium]